MNSAYLKLKCQWCGCDVQRLRVLFLRNGPRVFCGKKCFGRSRRQGKTITTKKAEKAAYDRIYRKKNLPLIIQRKREYHKRTYDPAKAAIKRKARAAWHVEYCRRYYADPVNHAAKVEYDQKRRDRIHFGPFADCADLVRRIDSEVAKRMTGYGIRLQQGTLNKMQNRKKALYEKNTR